MKSELDLLKRIAQQAITVRNCQREYFATRQHSALQASKKAEAELDALLYEWQCPEPHPFQESFL